MIGALISSLTGLATSIIDGKTQIKLTEAEIKKKQLTGEIDWDIEAMKLLRTVGRTNGSPYCSVSHSYLRSVEIGATT